MLCFLPLFVFLFLVKLKWPVNKRVYESYKVLTEKFQNGEEHLSVKENYLAMQINVQMFFPHEQIFLITFL